MFDWVAILLQTVAIMSELLPVLSAKHWRAGYDGRGTGGKLFSHELQRCFNACHLFQSGKTTKCVDAFMEKRQVPNHAYTQTVVHVPFIDFLYQQFCKGYTSVYFEDRQKLATAVCLLLRAF